MASAARSFARAAYRSAPSSAFKTTTRNSSFVLPRHALRQQSRRAYSSEAPKSSSSGLTYGLVAAAVGVGAYFGYGYLTEGSATPKVFTPTFDDYQKVYNEIASRLEEKDDYDDGSYGPVLVRLAWHASGTFDKNTGTGGSNGATMRFHPESGHGANAGLKAARDFLEPVKGMLSILEYAVQYPANTP